MERPSNPSRIYLDSCALISVIKQEQGHEHAAEAVSKAQAGEVTLLVSRLHWVEVRGSSNSEPFDTDRDRRSLHILEHPMVDTVELTRGLALKARQLCRTHGLKNYDAVHLASAILGEAEVLMTADRGFKLERAIEGVWVGAPYPFGQSRIPVEGH